jgi:REP element-mobilizing transposase RayT
MPSNKNITPLIGGNYYHVYNRGINRGDIFFQPKNYNYFLNLLKRFQNPYLQILAYCLLPNHFHLLIKLPETITTPATEITSMKVLEYEKEVGEFISEQFRRMLISFAQAINRQEQRIGGLFVRNFKRILLEDEEHLRYLFFYIHYNPTKHGICDDFKNYRFSSYKAYLSDNSTGVSRKLGFELFDGKQNFIDYHNYFHEEKEALNLE